MRRDKLKRIGLPVFAFISGLLFSPIIFSKFEKSGGNGKSEVRDVKSRGFEDVDLLVFVLSAPGNIEKRNSIRETWLSSHHSQIRGYFVIGILGLPLSLQHTLEAENKEYEDLVLLNMKDSYDSLTEKLVRTLEYAADNEDGRLFMKCDDDTFVNTVLLAKEIESRSYRNGMLYWGYFDGRAPVMIKGKWSETDYNVCDRYIPYALGGGYIIGWDLLKHLARSGTVLKQFKNEDVSLGTWVAGINVKRIHDERFDTEWKSRGCLNNFLVTQNRSPRQIRDMWARVSTGMQLCQKEKVLRKSYAYHWDLPPSQCCPR